MEKPKLRRVRDEVEVDRALEIARQCFIAGVKDVIDRGKIILTIEASVYNGTISKTSVTSREIQREIPRPWTRDLRDVSKAKEG